MDEVTDVDVIGVYRHFGQVFADGVIKREKSLCCRYGDHGSGELLARRANIEDGLRCDWYAAFQVCHAVAALMNEFSIFDHGKHTTGGFCPVPLGEKGVYSVGKR